MGVVISPSPSVLEDRVYLAGKRENVACRSHALASSSSCGFDLYNCCFPIPQFVNTDDPTDVFSNDYFSFIFETDGTQATSGTITNLITGDVININDNTYGTLYGFGDFTERPNVAGFVIDWGLIVAEFGYGKYQVLEQIFDVVDAVNVLNRTEIDLCFEVMPFDCNTAHGTVRFETVQTGYIHNGFDYRGIFTNPTTQFGRRGGWKQQLRWYGRMFPDTPDEESDFIQMSNRKETPIQQKTTDKFKIELHRLRSDFGEHLMKDNFLSTEMFVSDYNLNGYKLYRNVPLRKVSTDEIGEMRLNNSINPVFTFKSIDEGTLKRIYG